MANVYSAYVPHSLPEDIFTADLEHVKQYLHFILCGTIVTCIFGIDVAVDRALRFSLRTWRSMTQDTRMPFYNFITTYFPHLSLLPGFATGGVPPGGIPLFLPIFSLDAPIYVSLTAERPCYHILDVVAANRSRLIPSTLFISFHQDRSAQRRHKVLDRISPIPLWFFREDGIIGVPIHAADSVRLLCGPDELYLNSQDRAITTLKIKFSWPNYRPVDKQIRASSSTPLNNLNELARLTAGAVRSVMIDERARQITNEDSRPHPWKIGTQPGEIRIVDVQLLGVIFVSDGAAMPLLALID